MDSIRKLTLIVDPQRQKVFRSKNGVLDLLGNSDELATIEQELSVTHQCQRRVTGHGWTFAEWVHRD